MKQMRGLLIAALALAVLSGLVYWSKKHKAEEAAKPAADAPPKILTLDDAHVNEVTLQKAGADPVVLTKIADRWEITKPQPMPADQDTVKSLVSTASSLTADRLIDDHPATLTPFGLATPATQITIGLNNGKPKTLDLGGNTPGDSASYVKLTGDPRVFTIASYSKTSLDKSLNDLRDKRVLTFDQDKLARLDLTAKGQTVEFGKNAGGDWQIVKPEPMRAEGTQVDDLIRKIKDAKLQIEGGKIAESTFAATPKIATVAVTDNGGTQTVDIRETKDKVTYAKSSVADGIYKIGSDVADATNKSVTDFRSKKLFDFGFSDLSQVTTPSATYTRSGEKWSSGGKEMDGPSVKDLIDKLRDLSATGFDTKAAGTQIFSASVTTQDKKRTEHVTLFRDGTLTVATREGEPAVYNIDNGAADDLIKAAGAIKPAAAKIPAKK